MKLSLGEGVKTIFLRTKTSICFHHPPPGTLRSQNIAFFFSLILDFGPPLLKVGKKFGAFGIVSLDICFLGTAFVMPLISEYDSDLESSELGRKWTY